MTTVGVKWQEGVGIDWQTADYAILEPVWAEDLPLEGTHCYFSLQSRKWVTQKDPRSECASWKYHPAQRGKTPFLRFIHAFGEQLTDLPNPFHGDDSFIIIDPGSSVTNDGRRASCEIYFVKKDDRWQIAMRVFLIRTNKVSPIECWDERYLDACIAARAAVDQGYIDEEENT